MADLKLGTQIGGNLVWHQGNLRLVPTDTGISYKTWEIITSKGGQTIAGSLQVTGPVVFGSTLQSGGITSSATLTGVGSDVAYGAVGSPAFGMKIDNTALAHWLAASMKNDGTIRSGIQVLTNDVGSLRLYTNLRTKYVDVTDGQVILSATAPTADNMAARKDYVDNQVYTRFPKNGGILNGYIDASSYILTRQGFAASDRTVSGTTTKRLWIYNDSGTGYIRSDLNADNDGAAPLGVLSPLVSFSGKGSFGGDLSITGKLTASGRLEGTSVYFTSGLADIVTGSDGASQTATNLRLESWFGIGFGTTYSGGVAPVGQNSVWFDVRSGNISALGSGWFGAGLTAASLTTAGALNAASATIGSSVNAGGFVTGGNVNAVNGIYSGSLTSNSVTSNGATITGLLVKKGGGDFIIQDQNGVANRELQIYNIGGGATFRSDMNTDGDAAGSFVFHGASSTFNMEVGVKRLIASTPSGSDYSSLAIETRGTGSYAPGIGFHKPGEYGGSLKLLSGNNFAFYQIGGNTGLTTANIHALDHHVYGYMTTHNDSEAGIGGVTSRGGDYGTRLYSNKHVFMTAPNGYVAAMCSNAYYDANGTGWHKMDNTQPSSVLELGNAYLKIYRSVANNSTVTQNTYNVLLATENILENNGRFGAGFLSAATSGAAWIAGYFGLNDGGSIDRVVVGNEGGRATIGAHNGPMTAWANLYVGNTQGSTPTYIGSPNFAINGQVMMTSSTTSLLAQNVMGQANFNASSTWSGARYNNGVFAAAAIEQQKDSYWMLLSGQSWCANTGYSTRISFGAYRPAAGTWGAAAIVVGSAESNDHPQAHYEFDSYGNITAPGAVYVNGSQATGANSLTRKDYVDDRDWYTRWENKLVPNHGNGDANNHYNSEWDGSGVANAPSTEWHFFREISHSGGNVWNHQEAFAFFADEEYFRRGLGSAGSHGPWRRRWHSGNFDATTSFVWRGRADNGDLNNFSNNGSFEWTPTTVNTPVASTYGNGFTISKGYTGNDSWSMQIGFSHGQGLFYRAMVNSNTGGWVKIATEGGSPTFNTVYSNSWFRSNGATGWYNETYGGGIYMEDATWVRTHGGKKFYVANTDTDAIHTAGGVKAMGAVTAYSDIRLKTDIKPIENALEKVKQTSGVTYTQKSSGKRMTGVIAQEIYEVLPEAVDIDSEGMMSVAYGNLVGLLIQAVKELSAKVDELSK